MFSGIVEESAVVDSLRSNTEPYRLVVKSSLDHQDTALGDSICIEGVCLTVVEKAKEGSEWLLSFDLAAETVRRSSLGSVKRGSAVNLERSLRVGSRVHGHFVFGHVDAVVELLSRENDGNCDRLEFRVPENLMGFIAEKGSVSLSGISLTVGEVKRDTFSVYIVPHTNDVTTLSSKKPGEFVNFEVDMLARYVARQAGVETSEDSTVNTAFLREHGFIA